MNSIEVIKSRKSTRTFNGSKVATEDREKLLSYIKSIENP